MIVALDYCPGDKGQVPAGATMKTFAVNHVQPCGGLNTFMYRQLMITSQVLVGASKGMRP